MFATISDDRIFETVTNTLRQGGALATNISRQDAARGLEAVSRSVRALDQHQDATGHSETWKCEEGGKTFGSARALDQHQDATGHNDGSDSYSGSVRSVGGLSGLRGRSTNTKIPPGIGELLCTNLELFASKSCG